ncbi:hypothetical protein OG268_25330 [Streptomyces uncialis]|nr:hypothetical protein OG268_25330 [Streptomyces uncialis]
MPKTTPRVYSGEVPEDVGGKPLPGGEEPDDRDHGSADEEFASVVLDEDFIRAAEIREPSAVERLLAAAEARAEATEAEARRTGSRAGRHDDPDGSDQDGFGPHRDYDPDDRYARDILEESYGRSATFMGHARWHRPVAWLLALVMGVGMVALAFAAVYRGASSSRQDPVPRPSSTGLEKSLPTGPATSADHSRPPVTALPRTP